MTEYCICGHSVWDHRQSNLPELDWFCNGCINDRKHYDKHWHSFKLDNLRWIEAEAKERNLI